MAGSINRAQFLTGDFLAKGGMIRPPWALLEEQFLDKCTTCGDCIRACPDNLLVAGRAEYPVIDFSLGACDFCQECLFACKPKALAQIETESSPWNIKAEIQPNCLSSNAVMCRSCGDACDEHAIRFELKTGGVAKPILDKDKCTGCGGCFAVCPIDAIQIFESKNSHADAA